MKSIDIKTTQNVTISYELASLSNRFFAWFIDMTVIGVSCLLFLSLLSVIIDSATAWVIVWYLTILPIFFFYTLAFEWFTGGQTPGKMAMKIKVVKIAGVPLNFTDLILRWSFRMADIYFSLGSIAAVLINSTDFGQRLGDVVANTTVIRVSSGISISLDDILRIKTIQEYTPVYPEVRKLDEEDMLLVKKVLERSSVYPNRAHLQALKLIAHKMARFLNLDDVPEDERGFLNTCIRDYIVLTR